MKFYNFLIKHSFWISILLIILYLSPYFILGKNAYVCLFDIMEFYPMYKVLAESGKIFADNYEIIPNVMNGLPRVSYPSEYFFLVWLFYFIKDTFYVHVINMTIIHFIAYFGARCLLKNHGLNYFGINTINKEHEFIVNISALYFALLPQWPLGGLSIMGFPLLLNYFLNFVKGHFRWKEVILFFLLPFYSSFMFAEIFYIFVFIVILLYISFKERQFLYKVYFILIGYAVICVFTEYRLFLSVIDGFVSHREEFHLKQMPFTHLIKESISAIINNYEFFIKQYSDAQIRIFPVLLTFTIGALFATFLVNLSLFKTLLKLILLYFLCTSTFILSARIYSFFSLFLPEDMVNLVKGITLRTYIFNPSIWMIIYFFTNYFFYFFNKQGRGLVLLVAFFQIVFLLFTTGTFANFPIPMSLENPVSNNFKLHSQLNYEAYYDEELFKEIKKHIHYEKKQYRVACLTEKPQYPTFSPAVLIHNGFYTIDGYCVYYPKKYKTLFYEIIKKELDKSPSLYSFKTYGNRVYLCTNDTLPSGEVKSFDLNYELLKKLNVSYLFSTRIILEPKENIELDSTFQGKYWKIYLYKIK